MVWAGPRSLAATSGVTDLFSFPAGTEMVHFPALASVTYGFSHGNPGMSRDGLPHSEICGSKLVCSSPQLIAAYHVLHRLLAPRHSPCALSSLTIRTRAVRFVGSRLRTPGSGNILPVVRSPEPVAHTRQLRKYTLRVCGRKTTVAEYSVVKELVLSAVCSVRRSHQHRGTWHDALNQVENTGLEPVTSWLQTRRSPS